MLTCPSLVLRPQTCNTARIKVGRTAPISAIVLHPLTNITVETFEVSMGTPLVNFNAGNSNPLSVHFIVTDLASIQYAEIDNTTYGLDYLKAPTWPGITALYPLDDVNAPFIHIAVKADCHTIAGLVSLICCIKRCLGIDLPVIASSDLQCDRPQYVFDPTFTTQVEACVGDSVQPAPNWIENNERIARLEVCCITNTAKVIDLQRRVDELECTVNNNTCNIHDLIHEVTTLQMTVAQIPAIINQLTLIQQQISDIRENCCPDTAPTTSCFQYQLMPGQEQTITPNQPVRINLPTKIRDTTPPIVTPGPLWRANLSQNCTWSLKGTVRFKLNQWCAGTNVWLFIVACGVRSLVAPPQVLTTTGQQLVQVSFDGYLQPGGCNNVFLEMSIDDQTAQIITFAEFEGCCT